MSTAQTGSTVSVAYTGTLEDGTVFDQTQGDNYLSFTIGQQQLLEDFEQAVIGMQIDETKNIDIPASRAYGEYDERNTTEVTRSRFPDNINPEVGMRLQIQGEGGQVMPVSIKEVTKNTVVLDANHVLAGKDLKFEITLKSVS